MRTNRQVEPIGTPFSTKTNAIEPEINTPKRKNATSRKDEPYKPQNVDQHFGTEQQKTKIEQIRTVNERGIKTATQRTDDGLETF